MGGGGGSAPLQNKLSLPPAPQDCEASPEHGILQSLKVAMVASGLIKLSQSVRVEFSADQRRSRREQLTTLLGPLDTGIDEVSIIAERNTILDGHICCVGIR